jgi:transcriptional regulator with XRE-family HTH domain
MGDLGAKIREKRKEQNMSIKELATRTGLTSGFISQVERNQTEPSITSLRKVAQALDVAVFYFFIDEVNNNSVVRKSQRQKITFPDSHLVYELLSPDLNRQMEMFFATLEPGAVTCDEPLSHNGEEVTLVLKGQMEIEIGIEKYLLGEGDSIYYFATSPHRIVNNGNVELEFISTITPPRF